MSFLVVVGVLFASLVLAIWLVVQRGFELKALAERGAPFPGETAAARRRALTGLRPRRRPLRPNSRSRRRRMPKPMTLSIATAVLSVALSAVLAGQVSGVWTLTLDPDFGGQRDTRIDCTFTTKGESLTGTCGGSAPITGQVRGETVRFDVKTGPKNELTAKFEGVLDSNAATISGSWTLTDETGKRSGKFSLKKP
jgi:hypothetical protein